MKEQDYFKAISFFSISFQFFSLVQNALNETIKQRNPSVVRSSRVISIEEYTKKTLWSDHRIIIPILFNFYHGIELLLKALLQFNPDFELKAKHSIEGLSSQFIENNPEETILCDFLRKYTHRGKLPETIKAFLEKNMLTIDKLYEALRYPTDPSFNNTRSYLQIKHQGEEGIKFFKNLIVDIEVARIAAVRYGRSFEPDNM